MAFKAEPPRTEDAGKSAQEAQRIDTDLLIPGKGQPIAKGTLIYITASKKYPAGIVMYAGATSGLPDEYTPLQAGHHVPVLMPGLWDWYLCARV